MVGPVVGVAAVVTSAMVMRVVALSMRVGDQGAVSVSHLVSRVLALSPAATDTRLIIGSHLVSHLSASASPAELPMWLETVVPIDADDAPIQHRPVQSIHGQSGFLASGVLYETEATRLHLDAIQTHDKVYDLAT